MNQNIELKIREIREVIRYPGPTAVGGLRPHLILSLEETTSKPEYLKYIHLPLELESVKEIYKSYKEGKKVSIKILDSKETKEAPWGRLFGRVQVNYFDGEIEVDGCPEYKFGFSFPHTKMIVPEPVLRYLSKEV